MKKTAQYYNTHPKAKAKKAAYRKKYNAKKSQVKKREELTKLNRLRGTYGNNDNLDIAHTIQGLILQKPSINRGSKTAMRGDRRARGKRRGK